MTNFTYQEALANFGKDTKCYLTGIPIDIYKEDYQLDHIIPVSKGGTNDLENMGLTIPIVNQMKSDLTVEELLH